MSDQEFSLKDLCISEEDWQQTPPAVRGALGSLHGELAKIKEQLNLNSDSSSKPPSSDKPRRKREQKGKLPSGKKCGAQPGHKGNRRQPKPPDQVNEFRIYKPEACRHCGEVLTGEDAIPPWAISALCSTSVQPL